MNCRMQPLSVVAKIDGGYAFKSEAFSDIGVPVIRISNINEGRVNLKETARVPESFLKDFSAFRLNPCDILIAMSGATTGKIGVVPSDINEPLLLNQRVGRFKILDHKKLDQSYLRFIAESNNFQTQIQLLAAGAAQSNISGKQIESIQIPLPPLEVKKKIAAVLEKADALRRKREEQIKRLNGLLQATFLDMFGDPVTNPKGWPEIALEKIADIKSGVTKGRILKGKVISIPYMRVANVQDGKICLDEIKEIQIQANELEKFALQYGDILLTEGGDPDKLGRGAVWLSEIEPCIHQNHIFRVRPDESEVLPEFLSALIGSSRGKRYFFRSAKQTTGIASINMTQLKNFPALVPPLSKQKAFQNFIVRHQTTIKAFSKLEEATTCLFNSLMQRAFKGELELK